MSIKRDVILVNVDKIKGLAKDKGVSITHLCAAVGRGRHYFVDVKKNGGKIPMERLIVIADLLNTTVEYLTDQTDDPHRKENPISISNELWEKIENEQITLALIEMILKMPNEQRKTLYNSLK